MESSTCIVVLKYHVNVLRQTLDIMFLWEPSYLSKGSIFKIKTYQLSHLTYYSIPIHTIISSTPKAQRNFQCKGATCPTKPTLHCYNQHPLTPNLSLSTVYVMPSLTFQQKIAIPIISHQMLRSHFHLFHLEHISLRHYYCTVTYILRNCVAPWLIPLILTYYKCILVTLL